MKLKDKNLGDLILQLLTVIACGQIFFETWVCVLKKPGTKQDQTQP